MLLARVVVPTVGPAGTTLRLAQSVAVKRISKVCLIFGSSSFVVRVVAILVGSSKLKHVSTSGSGGGDAQTAKRLAQREPSQRGISKLLNFYYFIEAYLRSWGKHAMS